jgi:hypothetical protein
MDPEDRKLFAQARAAQLAREAQAAETARENKRATGTVTKAPTNDAEMIAALNAQIEKSKVTLAALEKSQSEGYVLRGLNPDGSKKTATQLLQEKKAQEAAARSELEATDPIFNKAAGAPKAPPGYKYTWIGGTNTGQWQLYSLGTAPTAGSGATGGAAVGGGSTAATDALNAMLSQQQAAAKAAADKAAAEKMASKVKASDRLTNLFKGYGIEGLATFINQRIMEDASEESVLIELYDRPEYQLRFPGMKSLRGKNRTISEKEYIDIENAFVQTARFFDIPKGFYDSADDFGNLIGNEVSAKEFQDRLQVGQDVGKSLDPNVRQALKDFYGIGEGGITAYVLNADKALPILQKQAKAATIAGIAKSAGFNTIYEMGKSEELAGMDAYAKLSEQQLKQGFGTAQAQRAVQQRLARIEGVAYNEQEALQATIEGSAMAQLESKKRAEREAVFRFGGRSGVGGTSLRSTTNQ